MRTILLVLALGAASAPAPAVAAPYDYPWCVMGGELGYSGDCSYSTRAQCLASASGRWNTYCDVNPRVLFEEKKVVRQKGAQQLRVH
jgi:hypothetical protein